MWINMHDGGALSCSISSRDLFNEFIEFSSNIHGNLANLSARPNPRYQTVTLFSVLYCLTMLRTTSGFRHLKVTSNNGSACSHNRICAEVREEAHF